jgi:hypothetical protein
MNDKTSHTAVEPQMPAFTRYIFCGFTQAG